MRWLLLFATLQFSLGWLLYQLYQFKTQQHLQQHLSGLQSSYQAVLNSYHVATEVLYSETISRPDVLSLFKQGGNSEGREQMLARGRLYRALYPTYERLQEHNLKQLHFHLPGDARSFLRFHRPEKFGDPLAHVRPSLRRVNEEKKPVYGFELGRIYSGFRYVFPVFNDEDYIGSVETSVDFAAIEQALVKLTPNGKFSFLLKGDAVFAVLFDENRSIYVPSGLHPDYFYEDLGVRKFGEPTALHPLIKQLNGTLENTPHVLKQMNAARPFVMNADYQGQSYAISFIPIEDVEKNAVAYLLAYTPAPLLGTLHQELYWQLGGLALILLLLLGFSYRIIQDRRALRASQVRFEGIFNYAPVGIGLLGTDGYYRQANKNLYNMFGYDWEAFSKIRCLDLNHKDYVSASINVINRMVSGEISQWSMDKCFVRKDGSTFWGHHSMSALLDEKGRCIALICIITDLTERKKTEETLRKLSRAVEQSQNVVVITDIHGDIEFVNPAFSLISGYSKDEVIGKNPRLLKSGHQDPDFYEKLWNILVSGQTWHGEFYNRRKDGSFYWEAATISPIKNEHEEITHYIAVKENISERKAAEAALHEKNQQLIQLNQEKNEFLGITAHDLKNPLAVIKGFAEEIHEHYHDSPAQEVIGYALQIEAAAEKMFALVTNLLDVNAIESGEVKLQLGSVSLNALVKQTLHNYMRPATQKQIRLLSPPQEENYYVWAADDTLQQVLDNLISNAVKYSPPDSEVQVCLRQQDNNVFCYVQDQGPGLSDEDQAKLFGKFSRLTPRPTGNEHSTGLGLFIVKKLMEAMGGQVGCDSQLGKGSTFWLACPRAEAPQRKHSAPARQQQLKPGLKILLVEDNSLNRMVAQLQLKKLDLNADEAENGRVAVSAAQAKRYDFILMDIMMPELDGLQATRQILAQAETGAAPCIIAMTASGDPQEQQEFRQAGMPAYIPKPFKAELLKQVLLENGGGES